MLTIRNLHFKHKGAKEEVLKGISFDAPRGSITTVLGPNGAGKSTLFKCIAGLWRAQKGEILFEGKPIMELSPSKRAKFLSLVPQDHEPSFPYTVMDMVLMGRTSHLGVFSTPGKKDYEIAENSLRIVGIEGLKDKPYTKISGGERQLVLIARALAQEAPIMLLDEPTSHLDFRNQVNVLKKIKEIALRKDLVILMTLHDPNLASLFSDKVLIMHSGTKIAEGKPQEVITEELIKKVYEIEVITNKFNGFMVICPVI